MKQVINALASVLMVGGIALLVFAGVQYLHHPSATGPSAWSKSDYAKGKSLAAKLATPQTVSIPTALKSRRAKVRKNGTLRAGGLPAPGSEPAIRIVAPSIHLNAPVVETPPVSGVWDVADWAVGHLTTSPNPGAVGNMALSAHDDIKGEVFKRLGDLKPGDTVELYTRHSLFTYVVVNRLVVDPSDVQVLNATRTPTVTLISCSPYWVDTQRLVVQAVLKNQTAA